MKYRDGLILGLILGFIFFEVVAFYLFLDLKRDIDVELNQSEP